MELSPDITSEDLDVFLQETEEQIQVLDEDLIKLERQGNDAELMQEIFRAAHTIKGSAGMVGHQQMTQLAHSMESLLDQVRNGSLEVSTPLVDALLHALDLLRIMKDALADPESGSPDITDDIARVVAELNEAAGNTGAKHQTPEPGASLEIGDEAAVRLQEALDGGQQAYLIKVSISPESSWAVVRCFQVLNELSQLGEVIASLPTQAQIEAENAGNEVQVLLASQAGEDALRPVLAAMDDLTSIDISLYEASEASEAVTDGNRKAVTSARKGSQQSQTLRVDVERLDYLMNTIGELVIDRTRIQQIGRLLESRYRDDDLVHSLGETASHVVKVVDELQQEIMNVRMLPIGTVFSGFPRLVRDLAQKFEKRIDFQIDGQDTEVDRTVIERLRDPLMHLLRNSVDHGIESPATRRSAGKPEIGTIRLSAFHDQGHIVITVEDDGGGIDPDLIRKAAAKKGIISAEAISRLSDSEVIDLIFMPGTSTAEKTTEVSGRGVGMDVVKTNIEAINGFVTADTKLGEGTKFTLRLPLTLATLQSLLVTSGQITYAVPVIHVLETMRVGGDAIQSIEGKEVIRLRDKVVPLLRLSNVLNRGTDGADQGGKTSVVIVRIGERLVGLGVDTLVELQEIMVKPLGQYMDDIKGIAGASILGDGRVVLILDVPTLVRTSIVRGKFDLNGPETMLAAKHPKRGVAPETSSLATADAAAA